MKFSFDLMVGDRVIRIEEEVAGEHQFFQRMAFWDSIPVAGPGGEADLQFSYRTPKGFEYYAIECRSSGKQFDFGQLNKPSKDLFPKNWTPIQHGLREERDEWNGRAEERAAEPETASAPPPAPPPAPPAPRPAAPVPMKAGGAGGGAIDSPTYLVLQGAITELSAYKGADAVEKQISAWARGRELASLAEHELKQVLQQANGWLIAAKKVVSRQNVA